MKTAEAYENWWRFSALFSGLDGAFGYASKPPRWVKRPTRAEDWIDHLTAKSPGIGIAPLRPDNNVMFCAIDLDEPDFEAAREMQSYLPGCSWMEQSKSGNAHVWVFFSKPCPAWLAMGVMREATRAAGKPQVEVFPKNHDFARVRLGNYINLPFHGDQRPILGEDDEPVEFLRFLENADAVRTDPALWEKRAKMYLIAPPDQRERVGQFGGSETLHLCAEHVLSGDAGPVVAGHRSVVYFSLAKMLTNWKHIDSESALEQLRSLNESSPDAIPDSELERILGNAERGEYTSTGCDDPLFIPYAHPECPIAYPRR